MRIFSSNTKILNSELKAFPQLRALVIKAVKLNLLEAAYATGPSFNFKLFSPEGQGLLKAIGEMTSTLSLESGMPSFSATCLEDVNNTARLPLRDSFEFSYLLATHRKNLLTASIALSQEFDDLKKNAGDNKINTSRIDLIHDLFLEHKLIKEVRFILPELYNPLYQELNEIHQNLKRFFFDTSGLLDKINQYLNGKTKEIDRKTSLDAIYSGLFYLWSSALFFKFYTWNLSSQFPAPAIQYDYVKTCYRFGNLLKKALICEKLLYSKMDLNACSDYLFQETQVELDVYQHIAWHHFEERNSSNSIISLKDRVRELKLLDLLLKCNEGTHEARERTRKTLLKYRLLLDLLKFHGEASFLWKDLSIKYDPCHLDHLKTPIEDLNEDIRNFAQDFRSLNRLKIKSEKVNGPDFFKLIFEAFFEIAIEIETKLYRVKNGIFLDNIKDIDNKLSLYEASIEETKKEPTAPKKLCKKIRLQLERLDGLYCLYNTPRDVAPFWEDEKTLALFREVKNRGRSLLETKTEAITAPDRKPFLSF